MLITSHNKKERKMEMKITSETEDGRKVFRVGDLPFSSMAEAEEFVEWFSWLLRRRRELTEAAEQWAAGKQQHGSGNLVLHDVVTSLAHLSFVLGGVGVVEEIHLAMIRRILATMEDEVRGRQEFAEKMSKMSAANKKLSKSSPSM
jgi:hypothetical protein